MAGIRYCESCGAVLQADYRFCETCGAPVRVLASGPSGASAGNVFEVTAPGYGSVPEFNGGYGGYESGVPGRVTGGNEAFVGAVPPPGGNAGFYPGETKTEILGRGPGNRPTEDFREGWYNGYSGPGDSGAGYDRYPGDVPPGESSVPEGFERGWAGGISADPGSSYEVPAEKPKLKNSMGPASAKAKGESVSDEAKPYFREGGDL